MLPPMNQAQQRSFKNLSSGRRWAALLAFAILAILVASTPVFAQPRPSAALAAEQRIQWYRDAKFGMFIHWGPYSQLAGEWHGRHVPVGTESEWIMQRFNIPVKEYREVARSLNPVKFDAEGWVRLAKQTGMKYLVITAKHHDGFAMYHSRVSNYNIVDWSGFKRDPVEELSRECRKAGIRFCVYYSHREDWEHPDGYGNNWDYDRSQKQFDRYLEQKSKPQLRELLSNYGPLGLIWFDRGLDTPEQAADFVKLVRGIQPDCLVNGRVGNYGQELMGDYQNMADNGMPSGGLNEYWETPQTLNTTWGYSRFDQQWKTAGGVIQRLVEIVSKGGNYLLNIGPMGDGTIPAPSVAVLGKAGTWVRANGESIYGTSACPVEFPWGRCTVKGPKLYLHVFSWPSDGLLRVSGLRNQVRAAYPLLAPSHRLEVSRDSGVTVVALPAGARDEIDTVIVAEMDSEVRTDPPTLTQSSDAAFELDYMTATTSGRAAKRFNRDGKFHISKWTSPGDSVTWRLLVSQAGPYRVRVRYAARPGWAGGKYVVELGGQRLEATVEATGEWYRYKTFDLGTIDVSKAGEYSAVIRPAAELNHYLMYFQSIVLEPPNPATE